MVDQFAGDFKLATSHLKKLEQLLDERRTAKREGRSTSKYDFLLKS